MSQQPATVQYLSGVFESLDPMWIETLVSQFPTAKVEFLTEQCLARCQQINAEEQKANHNNNDDIDIPMHNTTYINHNESKHDSNHNHASNLPPDQHNFLYPKQPIDSDDEVISEDKITDQGPSITLLSSVPKDLSNWFESFSSSIPITFHPGLLEILLHLEMVKYNTAFAFSPKPNTIHDHSHLIKALDFLINLLNNVESNFNDTNYRMFPKSEKTFCEEFSNVEGSQILLKYTGWIWIETDKVDNGGLYVYNEENEKAYLNAIIQLLTMYRHYLKGNKDKSNQNNDNDEFKWNFDNNKNKNNNFLSIFESEDRLEEKDIVITRQDSYITPYQDTISDEDRIDSLIKNGIDIDIPRNLNVNEYLLRRRAVIYGNNNADPYSHQWPQRIPGYALMEEHKKNDINIYTYSWDEFPHHRYRYLAIECELNKFARINVSIHLANCSFNDIKSGSELNDVQIFGLNDGSGKTQVLTELGPFDKKLIFTVKYSRDTQLLYSWRYNGENITLNDITEYINNSNNMLSQATEKYLKLYQRFDLHKMADNVSSLYNILQHKLNIGCFIDLEFPPLTTSLMSKSTAEFKDRKAFEGLIWKRAISFAEYPHLFGPAIMLSDVEQGKLGNCGFAASLTAISIYPQLIEKLFVFPNGTESSIGLYEVKLCHNGIWRQYTIDDLIPCNYGGNIAFTSHENSNFLWVSLIEKCAAKSYGGYDRLIAFCKLNAFNDLTGCPVEEINFDLIFLDDNVCWKHLLEWNNNKYIVMTLAATMERSKRPISDLGITGNHAFTFLRAVQIENIRLIQIRNPWGKTAQNVLDRWKGNYSRYNYNGEWTQTLKDIIRPGLQHNDGTFWMTLSDFTQYFRSASLCHLLVLNKEYKICRINTKIIYNYDEKKNCEDILYPKLILDLSGKKTEDSMELEWIGLQQENIRSQYAIHYEYLDCCLLIGQLRYPNDNEKCNSDNAAYIEPLRITQCRKSKTEFERIFAQLKWGQKYILIPYSTGITFHKNYKTLKEYQKRNVNISLYIKNKNGLNIQNDECIKFEYLKSLNIDSIKPILTHFVEVLGTKRQSGDLEYIKAQFGTLVFSGIRHTKIDKIMRGTLSFDLLNTLPAIGFDQGFILKNNICKQIQDLKEENEREWKWIYTVNDLPCMQTELFVIGQYQRFKRQQWRFNPEIFFSSIHRQSFHQYHHNNNNNQNQQNNDWFDWSDYQ